MSWTLDPIIPSVDPAGQWLTDEFLDNHIGDQNADFYADRDNDANNVKLYAAKRQAMLTAEDQASRMLARRYRIPISPLSGVDLFTLQRLTAPIAVYELWIGRGQTQSASPNPYAVHPYKRARDDALAELDLMSKDGAEVSLSATEVDGWGSVGVGSFVFVPWQATRSSSDV